MSLQTTSREWVLAAVSDSASLPDPLDPNWLAAVTGLLATPQTIDLVEAIEVALKRQWRPMLDRPDDVETARAFSETFWKLGVLRKYKPYGIKFSTPFGYSIFDLRDGEGFSVQLHRTAKVEAFHILKCHHTAFALIAGEGDWKTSGGQFLAAWSTGVLTAGELGFRPQIGDVFVIDDLRVVHTILGCLLEEYATTSNDAVVRIHDQNIRQVSLPTQHPSLRTALRSVDLTPRHHVERKGRRWTRTPIPHDDMPTVVEMPPQGLRGYHLAFARAGDVRALEPATDEVTTVVGLAGEMVVEVAGAVFVVGVGESVPIAPGQAIRVRAERNESRAALCVVRKDLAFADLRYA